MQSLARWLWISCILCSGTAGLWAQNYPVVAQLQRTFSVSDVAKANVSLAIKSPDGTPLYRLQCHSAGYTGDPDFDYSGDFECRLSFIGAPNTYSTLLTEDADQSRDWESRGRFFAADIQGDCARVPNFGAIRNFKLRGMELTLKIVHPMFTKTGKLKSLRLDVTVKPDPSAHRTIAEVVPFPKGAAPSCKLGEYFVNPNTFSAGR